MHAVSPFLSVFDHAGASSQQCYGYNYHLINIFKNLENHLHAPLGDLLDDNVSRFTVSTHLT